MVSQGATRLAAAACAAAVALALAAHAAPTDDARAADPGELLSRALAPPVTPALASAPETHKPEPAQPTPNTAPVAGARATLVPNSPTPVRIHVYDADGDAVSISVAGGSKGTISAVKQLAPTVFRIVYTPGPQFGAGDTLTVTPHDGKVSGEPSTVTVKPDKLPAGSTFGHTSDAHITDWYEVIFPGTSPNRPLDFSAWPERPPLPSAPVRHIAVETDGVDNGVVWLGAGGPGYRVAAPMEGTRLVDFASPLPVRLTLLWIGSVEDGSQRGRITVGTSAKSLAETCATPGAAIAEPRTFTSIVIVGWRAADGATATSSENVFNMRHAGTLASAKVQIQTRSPGSLTVELVAPDGTKSPMQYAGPISGKWPTYTMATTPPSPLVGKAVEGDWKIVANAPVTSLSRALLSLEYTATCPAVLPTAPSPTTPSPTTPSPYTIYVANTDAREVRTYLPDGTSSGTFVAAGAGGLGRPWSLAFGPDGNLYVADHSNAAIRRYSGSTGLPMGSGADAAADSLWIRPSSRPYGMAWNGNTLHVATYNGIERFSLAGIPMGVFGQASRVPADSGPVAAGLAYPHDVAFGGDRMYVADRGNNRIVYYSASTGAYIGAVSSATAAFTTAEPSGLAWRGSLYQSGGDAGQVNRISTPALAPVGLFSGAQIDEPSGMDVAHDGTVYVASRDTGGVAAISAAGAVSYLVSSGLDGPRDVAVGPRYAPALTPAASGAAG